MSFVKKPEAGPSNAALHQSRCANLPEITPARSHEATETQNRGRYSSVSILLDGSKFNEITP
jgi:hypothetical protein